LKPPEKMKDPGVTVINLHYSKQSNGYPPKFSREIKNRLKDHNYCFPPREDLAKRLAKSVLKNIQLKKKLLSVQKELSKLKKNDKIVQEVFKQVKMELKKSHVKIPSLK